MFKSAIFQQKNKTYPKDKVYMWSPNVRNEGPSEKIAFSNFIKPRFKFLSQNLIWKYVEQVFFLALSSFLHEQKFDF